MPNSTTILNKLKQENPNMSFSLKGSVSNTKEATQENGKVFATYAYCNCVTGEWGIASIHIHSFLGITWGET